jgi:predicted nucleic-acid-binding Zn-ribbon protein
VSRKPSLVTIGPDRRPFTCHVCRGEQFIDRDIQLNTSGMEFLGIEWANRSATGLICSTCGYVHMFVNDSIELWEPDKRG